MAQAADRLGFEGLLTPCGTMCEDAWLATAALIPLTERVKFLVAFRPGLLSPTLAAQMASTYQRLSGGRLLLNIVTGAEPAELARFGDFADKDTRYERTGEFIAVMRGAWEDDALDHEGRHYRVERRHDAGAPRSRAAGVLRRGVRGRRAGGRGPGRRLPGVGRAAGHGGRAGRAGAGPRRPGGTAARGSASAST